MSSSIFNSEYKESSGPESPLILLKILVVTLVMLVIYAFATKNISFPSFVSQSQFQENKYKAESFLNRFQKIDTNQYSVVVGSSLSALLKEEYFSKPTINLGFSGGSPLTGLEFLIQTKAHFKRIFVDATVTRPIDREMIEILENRFEMWRVRNLAITNVDHQPVSMLTNYLKMKFGIASKREFNQKQFEQGIEDQKQADIEFNQTAKDEYQKLLLQLKMKIDILQGYGIEIVMIEMPLAPEVLGLSKFKYFRGALHDVFDSNPKVEWIASKTPSLQTMDGMHLSPDSAETFVEELELMR